MTTNDQQPLILNYGGGSQTVTICCLIAEGILPRPDRIVMADTGREVQSTWDYLETHMRPLLATVGLAVEVAPHSLATVDIYSHQGSPLLPLFTETGKFKAYCSGEWKKRVVQRYLRSCGVNGGIQWLGYAYDETRRWQGKTLIDGPWTLEFPLVDRHLTKADCEWVIRRAGLPQPSKSRCWMCPNQPNAEWRDLRDTSPEEFEEACKLDDQLREDDETNGVFLHQSRVPLRVADLDAKDRREPDTQCTLGTCFV